MTDNAESASIDLSVNADEALQVFAQLSAAARDADEQVQQLRQHLAAQVTTAFGVQGQQPQTYQQASAVLSRMDPTEVAQAAPDIAQTKNALAARSAEIQARAMDFAGTTPNLATQPPADVLAQFQQAMAARAQQQQAQRERQAQQQAADVERPARYGYDTPPPALQAQAASRPIAAMAPTMQVAGPMSVAMAAPLATTGDDRLAQALSAQAPPIPAMGTSAGRGDNAATSALPDDLQRLAAAAIAADEAIRRLQERLVEQVNAQMGAAGIRPQSYQQAQDLLQRMPAADLATAAPEITVTQQAISARSAQVTGQVADFAGQSPPVSGQPIGELLNELKAFIQQQQQTSTASGAPASLSGGAESGGAMSAAARYGLLPATAPQSSLASTDATQQDRAATTMGARFAQALTRSSVGMVTGGIQGAASAAGMGATGDLVGALARPLMELVSAPLAVIGGAAGIGLGVNALQSKYAGEQQGLAGSVGTTTGATPSSELTTAQQTGWSMMYHEADSVAAARQLGDMGVQSGQLGAGLTASMALSRVGGIGLDQTTALTGQMMQSGMSGNQVGDTYAQMDQAARQSGVSLGRLVEGIKALNQAAGVGQISVNGLAAAQALAGTSVNFAQASSGTVGSTGTGALAQAALLGLSPTGLEAAQKDPAKLMDAYANLARRYDVGSGGVQVAQQALSSAGFDFSGMKGPQADEFTRRLVAQGPGAAQAYEASLTKKENAPGAAGPHTADQFAAAGKAFADQVTPIGDQLKIAGEKAANALVRGAQDAAKSLTPIEVRNQQQQQHDRQYGPSGVGTSHTTNVNPMQQLTQSTQGRGGIMPLPGSYEIPNGQGNSNRVLPYQMQWYEDAAKKYAPPGTDPNQFLSVLLAQGSAESGFNENAVSRDKNGNPIAKGIAQFTPATAAEYGLKNPFDARQSIAAQARLDANLYASHGHNWQQSLAAYNGSGADAQSYGQHVYSASEQTQRLVSGVIKHTSSTPGDTAQAHDQQGGWTGGQGTTAGGASSHKVDVTVHATLDVRDQQGKSIPVTSQRTTHTSHSIDPSKKHVAAQSYGPADRTPPAPGLPTLPGHIGGPIRR